MRNSVQLKEIRDVNIGGRVYDTNFRHVVCQAALRENSTQDAADNFVVGNSTVWRWMKVYGYAPIYFADRTQGSIHYTPFDERRQAIYSDPTRLSAALLAVRRGYGAAMDQYRCSSGSIYNWIKCFKLSNSSNN